MIADQDLNLSGLNCPQHVMRCKAALAKLPHGALLHVALTDPRCHHDIRLLAGAQGDRIEHAEMRDGVVEYWIRRHTRAGRGGGNVATEGPATATRFTGLLPELRDQLLPGAPVPVA